MDQSSFPTSRTRSPTPESRPPVVLREKTKIVRTKRSESSSLRKAAFQRSKCGFPDVPLYRSLACDWGSDKSCDKAPLRYTPPPYRADIAWPAAGVGMKKVDGELMKIMVCPIAHAPLVQVGDWLYSTDPMTRRKYPVRDGIPIMLVDESQVADQTEFDRIMAQAKA